MTRLFCDRCKREHSESLPVKDYQIKAELETFDHEFAETGPEFAIEFKRLEICQPCAKILAEKCKAFIDSVLEDGGGVPGEKQEGT